MTVTEIAKELFLQRSMFIPGQLHRMSVMMKTKETSDSNSQNGQR